MHKAFAVVIAVGLASAPAFAAGQSQRVLELDGGFTPDPLVIDLLVAGDTAAADYVRGCPGYITTDGALSLTLRLPSTPLRFYLRGEHVAGLLLLAPDGIYRCAGVDANGIAQIAIERNMEGLFTAWPASAASGTPAEAAAVVVSERELQHHEVIPFELPAAADLEPARLGVAAFDLQAGDVGQRLAQGTVRGGVIESARLAEGCSGGVDPSAADLTVTLAEPVPALNLYAESGDDTVLLVLDPDGGWWCVDDAAGHNPAVTVAPAPAGRYQMLVASFSTSDGGPVTLYASLGEPRWTQDWSQTASLPEQDLGLGAEPLAGRHRLPDTGVLDVPVTLRAATSANRYADGCVGEIDPAQPHLVLTLAEPEPELHVYATSEADTALMVVTPGREVYCDDDTHLLHPEVVVSEAQPGDYEIWVALASGADGSDAVAHLSREAPVGVAGAQAWVVTPETQTSPPLTAPLIGRDFATASAALAILTEETPLGGLLGYALIEPRGAEGFTLHDAVLRDPEGEQEPVAITRIHIDRLDLEGLRERGEPARFALRMEGIDYAALAAGARDRHFAALPSIDPATTASLEASLLPAEGNDKRVRAELVARLDGQIALRIAVLALSADDLPGSESTFADMLADSIDVEIQNLGFLALALQEQAAEDGTNVEQLVSELLAGLRELLAPAEPGSLRAQLLEAAEAALAEPARPASLRVRIDNREPQSLDALFGFALQESPPADAPTSVRIEYLPLP